MLRVVVRNEYIVTTWICEHCGWIDQVSLNELLKKGIPACGSCSKPVTAYGAASISIPTIIGEPVMVDLDLAVKLDEKFHDHLVTDANNTIQDFEQRIAELLRHAKQAVKATDPS